MILLATQKLAPNSNATAALVYSTEKYVEYADSAITFTTTGYVSTCRAHICNKCTFRGYCEINSTAVFEAFNFNQADYPEFFI